MLGGAGARARLVAGGHGPAAWLGALLVVLLGHGGVRVARAAAGGTLRAEATLAAANLVYLLLLAGGAVVLPASSYGGVGGGARRGCRRVRSARACATR